MPPNRRLIVSKLVFNKKRYGRFRAYLVVQGYTQYTGVDFTEKYSPVVIKVTLHVILLMWLINEWDSGTIDVETEFLYALLTGTATLDVKMLQQVVALREDFLHAIFLDLHKA